MASTSSGLRWGSLATAVAVAASVAITFPAPAAATSTQRFDVWNMTGGPLTLYGYDSTVAGTTQPSDAPKPGTVVQVGQNVQFTLRDGQQANPRFNGRGQAQDWRVAMNYGNSEIPDIKCSPVRGTPGTCSPPIGNNVMALWDSPENPITVPAAQAQQQADLFNTLCTGPYMAALKIKCDYTNMARTDTNTPWHLPQDFVPQTNHHATLPSGETYKVSSTVSETTTVSLSAEASVKFFKLVNTAITAKWENVKTESHTYSLEHILPISPGHTGYLCMTTPLNHFVGTLVVKVGDPGVGTKWTLADVVVDTPNPTYPAHIENWDTEKYIAGDPCDKFVRGLLPAKSGKL